MKSILDQAIPVVLNTLQSTETCRAYNRWMKHFSKWYAETAPDQPVTHDLIVNYMTSLKEKQNPSSRAQALAAIKKLCETIHNQNREVIDLYTHTIIQSIKSDKYDARLKGKMIPDEAIQSILKACHRDDKPAGLRDASIIALLHSTGMRRNECANLKLMDFNPDEGNVLLKRTKNKKDRISYLTEGAIYHLKNWLSLRQMVPGPIYWRTKKGGNLWPGKGISGAAIYNIIQNRCKQAGVEAYTPHDFRRTLISNLLDQQVDISLVSKIVGHSSTVMTARYDRRDDERMRAAIAKIHTPFA